MQLEQQTRNGAETMRPVEALPRQQLYAVPLDTGFNAIAIEFYFVNPFVALGGLRHQRCETGCDERRKRCADGALDFCGRENSWPRRARCSSCFGLLPRFQCLLFARTGSAA